jgi:hypothetical protein
MKPVNVQTEFFTEDLYPEEGETGNAFWGYHIANNFGRLSGIIGTVFFDASQGLFVDNTHSISIPIDRFRFKSAPMCQLTSLEPDYSLGTVLTIGTNTAPRGWGLTPQAYLSYQTPLNIAQELETEDPYFVPTIYDPDDRIYIKLGHTSGSPAHDELMPLISYMQTRSPSIHTLGWWTWFRWYIVGRGGLETTPDNYDAGLNIYVVGRHGGQTYGSYYTIPEGNSWQQIYTFSGNTSDQTQPAWVEAYMDSSALTIRWLKSNPGTVVYRIFGV